MLDGFVDHSEIPTELPITLEGPISCSVEPLKTMLDLVMFTFSEEEVLNGDNRKFWNLSVNDDVESLDITDRGLRTARYSSTNILLLQ